MSLPVEDDAAASQTPDGLDALFAGTLFSDFVFYNVKIPEPGQEFFAESFAFAPGGIANSFIASARLGMETGFISVIGTDPLSRCVYGMLKREPHLHCDWLIENEDTVVPVAAAITNEHDRRFISYEDSAAIAITAPTKPLPHVGALQIGLDDASQNWVKGLRDSGTTIYAGSSYDPTERWDLATLEKLRHADAYILNEVESMAYTRTSNPREAAAILAEKVPLVVVTLGKKGALAIDSATGETAEIDAPPAKTIDPTGAGDVFLASFIAAAKIGRERGWDLITRLRFGALGASLSTEHLGGSTGAPGPTEFTRFCENTTETCWQPIRQWAKDNR